MRKLLTGIITILALAGCARMGQPDGGWFDDTPPRVLAEQPRDKSTNVSSQHINIFFNEFIKIDNPSEKVVISPPQIEPPDIKGAGKRISINIKDSLFDNTTYTIDFSDAITDNNEGNPLGNYTYSFSTGDHIDTLEVAGYVVNAENIEPIKGILVGLYNNLADTAFTTQPMLRVSRTDDQGHFVVKGVAPGEYRIFALQDADANYFFSQKNEMIAFNHDIIVPTCKPDVRQDTIWADTLHIASINQEGYTHFLPDDIVLRAFTEQQTDRFLLKTERREPDRFTLFFTYGHPQLPEIKGLNYDDTDAFILEASEHLDTLTYWLRDTTLIQQDTLRTVLSYLSTDTLGTLQLSTDTLDILAKTPYEKRLKDMQKEREKWEKEQEKAKKKGNKYETEMPVAPLDIKLNVIGDMMPNSYITLESPTPIALIDTTKIHLTTKIDTFEVEKPYILQQISTTNDTLLHVNTAVRLYTIRPDSTDMMWTPKTNYTLVLDSAAVTDIYGKASDNTKKAINIKSEEDYTTIIFHVSKVDENPYVGQLVNSSDKPVRQTYSDNGDLVFTFVKPGEYYLRVFSDANGNGLWDTGEYADDRQAETVWYYPEKIECKAKWTLERTWNLMRLDPTKLKPSAITKQKGEKKRQRKNQNIERARKLGIIYTPNMRFN